MVMQRQQSLEVTIVEAKDFDGLHHHNQCLGVLSPPIVELLEQELDLAFPYHLSRGEISEYVVHGGKQSLPLLSEDFPSIALRRVQFDGYMLDAARARGAQVMQARAVDIEFRSDGVVVYTEDAPIEADVVVGAFGLDEGGAAMFERHTRYRRPQMMETVVTKYHPGETEMAAFGLKMHAFLPAHQQIEFGAITPKGNHLSLNIAGRSVDSAMMKSFLKEPMARNELVSFDRAGEFDSDDLRYFKGRFPRSIARGYYGDRYVMVGDASGLVRAFKGKGVTSAIQTGTIAASTILLHGISNEAFHSHYRSSNLETVRDLPYGRLLRLATIAAARIRFIDPILRAARTESRLYEALYDAVSGRSTAREIWISFLSLGSIFSIIRSLFSRVSADNE
jgi:flavin-dependent dehydrogenase